MDKHRSVLNVTISLIFKVLTLIATLLTRRVLIRYIGNEMNGLNSLYLSIIGFLSVAELGVGSAITFCMYKPIVEGDSNKVAALYGLFRKLYRIIGGVIFAAGLVLLPFLPYLAKDYAELNVNFQFTFLLMLVSVALTYLYSCKISLINAYKDNYVTTTITSTGLLLQNGLQILVTVLTRSFTLYLVCRIIAVIPQWAAAEYFARKKHADILSNRQRLDRETGKEVTKNVRAMFMHQIGGVLVNTADSVIISAFIGVVVLGRYSNYVTIMTAMSSLLALLFSSLTSVLGHAYVENDLAASRRYFSFFHSLNFSVGMIFFLGYYAVIDDLVAIFFRSDLLLPKPISLVITANYFVQFMRQSALTFRNATGTFYNDRWKPLFEGLCNVALSITFVKVLPEDCQVVGVIVATIITNLLICHIVEPYVLFKYAFGESPKRYYRRNYLYIAVFAAALAVLHFCMRSIANPWLELLVNGCIAVGIGAIPCAVTVCTDRTFRGYLQKLWGLGAKKLRSLGKTQP